MIPIHGFPRCGRSWAGLPSGESTTRSTVKKLCFDRIRCVTLLSGLLLAVSLAAAPVDFGRDIQPILRMRCLGCHNARQQTSGLRLDNPEHALKGGYAGAAIKPGNSGASRLYQMVTAGVMSDGKRVTMPPNAPLPPKEAALLRDWIDQGALDN